MSRRPRWSRACRPTSNGPSRVFALVGRRRPGHRDQARVAPSQSVEDPAPLVGHVSVERAREMILEYRRRYRDTATIRQEFVSVDEKRHRITWRLRGAGADGSEVTEEIVLQTGDGLIGVVGIEN